MATVAYGMFAASIELAAIAGASAYIDAASPDTVPDVTAIPCALTSPETDAAVEQALAEAPDPAFQHRTDYRGSRVDNFQKDLQARKQAAADKAGVTIVDLDPAIIKLEDKIYSQKKADFNGNLAFVNTALQPYDISVSLQNKPLDDKNTDLLDFSQKDLETRQSSYDLVNILRTFDDKPVELIDQLGVHSVKLYKAKDTNHSGGYVTSAEKYDTVHLRLGHFDDESGNHELGHIADNAEHVAANCESIYDDPQFEAIDITPGLGLYVDRADDRRYGNLEDYKSFKERTQYTMESALRQGDRDTVCTITEDRQTIGAAARSFSTYHGAVQEEKAEGYSHLLSDDYSEALDQNAPVTYAESIALLKRLGKYSPGSAAFLIATANRPTSNEPMFNC